MRNLTASAGLCLRLSVSAAWLALLGACGGGGDSPPTSTGVATSNDASAVNAADANASAAAEGAAEDERVAAQHAGAITPRRYAVEFLGPVPPHVSTRAAAINNKGQVAGTSSTPNNGSGENRATVWTGPLPVALTAPPGCTTPFSSANAINDAGQVAGSVSCAAADGTRSTRAIRWDNRTIPIDLSLPEDPVSEAVGINAAGHVVGRSSLGATLWIGTARTQLTPLGGDATVRAINDAGQAAGDSRPWTDPVVHIRLGAPSATLWNATTPTDLGIPFASVGLSFSWAMAINNAGQSVGFSQDALVQKAVLWNGTTPVDLGGTIEESAAFDINSRGKIVGYIAATFGAQRRAALWNGTVATDLNTLVPRNVTSAGWSLTEAVSINDRGLITGNAFNSSTQSERAYRLIPLLSLTQCALGWRRFGFSSPGQCIQFLAHR